MMGNPGEMNGGTPYREQQKATFSGMTALIGVIALIIDIIAVAVPHWGYYSPGGPGYYRAGKCTKTLINQRKKQVN